MGSDSEDGRVSYVNNEHVEMLSNFPLLKMLTLAECSNVSAATSREEERLAKPAPVIE